MNHTGHQHTTALPKVWSPVLLWSLPSVLALAMLLVVMVVSHPLPERQIDPAQVAEQYRMTGLFNNLVTYEQQDALYLEHLERLSTRDKPLDLEQTIKLAAQGEKVRLGDILAPILETGGLDPSVAIHAKGLLDQRMSADQALSLLARLGHGNGFVKINQAEGELTITLNRAKAIQQGFSASESLLFELERLFPDAHEQLEAKQGMVWRDRLGNSLPFAEKKPTKQRVILLVTGGVSRPDLWSNLDQPFHEAGYQVLEFRHVPRSSMMYLAEKLANALDKAHTAGIEQIDIVTHGYGGLVVRDMLTRQINRRIFDRQGRFEAPMPDEQVTFEPVQLPKVNHLIMLAPPNQGYPLAKVNLSPAVGELLVKRLSGDGLMFSSQLAVGGSIRQDLRPGSEYLTELNQNTLPEGIHAVIIAGTQSPVRERDVQLIRAIPGQNYSENVAETLHELEAALENLVDGHSDGTINVEATKLANVPLKLVLANHITMLRDIANKQIDATPPAVKLICDILSADQSSASP